MKPMLSILLLCAIFGNILSSKFSRKRLLSRFKLLKLKKNSKEKLRNLEISSSIIDSEIYESSYNSTNTDSDLHILKFHNYLANSTTNNISFSVFFYFIGRDIAQKIKMPLKITYNSRIRILGNDESVESECNIKENYKGLSKQDSGVNVDYKCEAGPLKSVKNIDVSVNTYEPLVLHEKDLSFDNVYFDPTAAKEAANIQNSPNYDIVGVLDKSKVDFKENSFTIVGDAKYDDESKNITDEEFKMEFYDYLSTNRKKYDCKGDNTSAIVCSGSIKTYLGNMTNAASSNSKNNIYLKINIDPNEDANKLIDTSSSSTIPNSKKSSGGLSGGAIAGIVIAGVVVLAGATIAAIMLGRSKPPLDQTSNMVISSTKIV